MSPETGGVKGRRLRRNNFKQRWRKYTVLETRHGSTKAESCDNGNTAIVTNQQVLKLWKEDGQLCCHPFTKEMCQEKVKKRQQMKKESERLWTTVQRTERDQMSNCCCVLFFPEKKNKDKNCNTAPVVTVRLQHHHYRHFTVLITPLLPKYLFIWE